METINIILLTIAISVIFAKLYASHDALAERDGRKESLDHTPRLIIRIFFSLYVGLLVHPESSFDTLIVAAISFLSFHLVFDVYKNAFSKKPTWYLSKSSNVSDRFWNWISPKKPGKASFIVESVLLIGVISWYYIKNF